MKTLRYAVLNRDGTVVNHIAIDDPMPSGYHPGYGSALLCIGGQPDLTHNPRLPVLKIRPSEIPQIGDVIDVKTGQVTKFVPQVVQVTDDVGVSMMVATAPAVRMEPTEDV